MGAEVIVPLLISAAAGGATAYNHNKTLKRQDADAAAGIRKQQEHQREADARLNQEIGKLETSDPSAERAAAQEQFMGQLRQTRAARAGSEQQVPGASDRYTADVAERAASSDQQSARLAELMGAIDAPALQRRGEGEGFGKLRSELDQIGRGSAGDDFLTRMKIKNRRTNPWIDAAAQVAQSYAMSSAGNAGGGTANMGAQAEAAKRGMGGYTLAGGL